MALFSSACFDLTFIISAGLFQVLPSYDLEDSLFYIWIMADLFKDVGRIGSLYTTVVISLERFLAIFYPFCKKRNLTLYIVIIIFLILLVQTPLWVYAIKVLREKDTNSFMDLRSERNVLKRGILLYGLISGKIIPWLLLFCFNGLIIQKVTVQPRNLQKNVSKTSRGDATKILLGVVFVCFFTTILPRTLHNIGYNFEMDKEILWFVFQVYSVGSIVNSSANFFIYCLCGETFRKEVIKIFISL